MADITEEQVDKAWELVNQIANDVDQAWGSVSVLRGVCRILMSEKAESAREVSELKSCVASLREEVNQLRDWQCRMRRIYPV